MSIRPVEISVMQRMQEASQIKQNEISKPMTDQVNIQNQITKEVAAKSEQVVKKDDVKNESKHYDAKEKGDNEYYGDSSEKKRKDDEDEDCKVIVKNKHNFDVKI